jgi:hypothetical protein
MENQSWFTAPSGNRMSGRVRPVLVVVLVVVDRIVCARVLAREICPAAESFVALLIAFAPGSIFGFSFHRHQKLRLDGAVAEPDSNLLELLSAKR